MKHFFFLVVFLSGFAIAYAQTTVAITVTGDTVLLNDNGTWTFKNKHSSKSELEQIPASTIVYKKPETATKMVEGGKGVYQVWYDTKTWTKVSASKHNKDAELAFEMNNKLAFSMVIYEKLEIPVETLLDVAFDNAKESGQNMKVTLKEYREVNGKKVALMQMEGEVEGIKITYYSYYYSNHNGTWQFHTYTMSSFFKQFKSKMEDLLNGFIVK